MATSARAKIFTPDGTNSADVPADMLAMGQSLEPSLTPRFLTTAARDAAITAAIRNGDFMLGEGFRCYIANSGEWEYDGVTWQPMGLRVALSRTYHDVTAVSNSNSPGAVPGLHGQSFTLNRNRTCRATISNFQISGYAGDQWQFYVNQDGGPVVILSQGVFVNTGGAGAQRITMQSAPFVMTAGTHAMGVYVLRASGTGGYVTLLDAMLTVTDEGPA